MNINDRVRWKSGKPEDSPEHNGKITETRVVDDGTLFSVRWDDGTEEWAFETDLEVVT